MAPNVSRSPGWNLLHATLLVPRILTWFLDFWKICGPSQYREFNTNVNIIKNPMEHSGYSNKWKFRSSFVLFLFCASATTPLHHLIYKIQLQQFSVSLVTYWSYIVGGSETPVSFHTIVVEQYRWRCTSPRRWHEEIKHWILVRQKTSSSPSEPPHLLIRSTIPHNSLSSCSCSLFAWISVLKHLDSSLNESKPLHQLWKLVNVQPTACKLTELAQFICIHMWYGWQGIHYTLIYTLNNLHIYNKSFI